LPFEKTYQLPGQIQGLKKIKKGKKQSASQPREGSTGIGGRGELPIARRYRCAPSEKGGGGALKKIEEKRPEATARLL